jgi:hypothetical protein
MEVENMKSSTVAAGLVIASSVCVQLVQSNPISNLATAAILAGSLFLLSAPVRGDEGSIVASSRYRYINGTKYDCGEDFSPDENYNTIKAQVFDCLYNTQNKTCGSFNKKQKEYKADLEAYKKECKLESTGLPKDEKSCDTAKAAFEKSRDQAVSLHQPCLNAIEAHNQALDEFKKEKKANIDKFNADLAAL